MAASREAGIVDLPRAGVPADHGLASLGLVMQLAGRTSGALAALLVSFVVAESGLQRHDGWFLFAAALCIARSQVHRVAGRDLLYSRRTPDGGVADPFAATRLYIFCGIGHALAIGLIAACELRATPKTAAGIAAALALWPMVLALILRLPRFHPFRAGIPLGEDRGLEAASVLMTVLGACGALSTGALVFLVGGLPSRRLEHGWGTMVVVVFALLLVRSCLHMRVGIAGLRATSFDRPGALADRYVRFGMVSVLCVGGVLALLAMSARQTPQALFSVAVACWLFALWPVIVGRYFYHRQFAELFAGDRVLHRRAPDAGLTGLGWLLAGHAVAVTSLRILELTASHRGIGRSVEALVTLTGPTGQSTLDIAVAAAVVVLESVSAMALIRMSDHRRFIATIYALVAGAAALEVAWPMARTIGDHSMDLVVAMQWIPVAIQIAIPAATLVLVRRAVIPAARAVLRPAVRPSGRPDGRATL